VDVDEVEEDRRRFSDRFDGDDIWLLLYSAVGWMVVWSARC